MSGGEFVFALSGWQTLDCERVLYVDRGKNVILCDRLPSPITLVVKLRTPPSEEPDDD